MEYQPTARLLWTPSFNLITWAAVSGEQSARPQLSTGEPTPSALFSKSHPCCPESSGISGIRHTDPSRWCLTSLVNGLRSATAPLARWNGIPEFLPSEGTYAFKDPEFIPPQNGDPAYLDFRSVMENARYGKAFGAEVSAVRSATRRWKLNGGYSWLRQRMRLRPRGSRFPLAKDPSQQFQIRSQL